MKTLPGHYARQYAALSLRYARRVTGRRSLFVGCYQYKLYNQAARNAGICANNSLHSVEFDLWCKAKAYLWMRSVEVL